MDGNQINNFRGIIRSVSIIGSLIGLIFTLPFIVIGITVLLGGILNLRSVYFLDKTPIIELNALKSNQIAKFEAVPDSTNLVKSSKSLTPCVFYITEYIEYHSDEGSPYPSIVSKESSPENIKFTSDNNSFILPMNNPEPSTFFKVKNLFLLNKETGEYEQVATDNFKIGDKTIEEKIFLPDEKLTVFGKLNDLKPLPEENTKLLVFDDINIGAPWKDFKVWIKNFKTMIFENKLTIYMVSSAGIEGAKGKFGYAIAIFMIIFGLIFAGIPGSFAVSSIIMLTKRLLGVEDQRL